MKYPKTKKELLEEEIHGLKIQDHFRWLENGEDAEVLNWTSKQNKHTQKVLKEHVDKKAIKQSLLTYLKVGEVRVTTPKNGKYFWRERKGTQNQAVLYVKDGLKRKKRVLLDPNSLSKKGITTIDYWHLSPKANFIAYGVSEGGSEESVMHILDMQTGKDLKDTIVRARYSYVSWLSDESGFYYTRYPFDGAVPKGEELYHEKIYFHKLGTDSTNDELIFGEGLPKEDMLGLDLSSDNKWLVIDDNKSWTKADLFLLHTKTKKIITLFKDQDAKFMPYFHRNKLYVLTNLGAPRFKLIATNLDSISEDNIEWDVIIEESSAAIQEFTFAGDNLIVHYLDDVVSKLKVHNLDGSFKYEIETPTLGSINAIACEEEGSELFFSFESFFYPSSIFRHDFKKQKTELYQTVKSPINPDEFVLEQQWFFSKDGTRVPMFVFHKKDITKNKNNPFLMYGYGGFSVSNTPTFLKNWMPFLNKGGVMGFTNIRGGGEFGEDWHKAGMLKNKQNSFDDFIAAAEHVISSGYTSSEKLAIYGGSNGGLLVGAVKTQRPDLFRAVLCAVPLLDMIRFPKFLMAARWVFEYGDPESPEDIQEIIKWSPYHNVKEGVEYPATLFITANKDSRVDPLHARKMTALLQTVNKTNPVLIRVESDAGHGPGKPLSKIADERTDQLAFLFWQLGM